MRNPTKLVTAIAMCLLVSGAALSADAKREMNVKQGPETVFDQPVSQIVPGLEGATPTKENGRVGGEFVFWGYKLSDGVPAFFYACAAVPGVDCLERRQKICANSTKVLAENMSMGNVQKLTCRVTCIEPTPTSKPCCTSAEENADLQVGLVSCGG